MQSIELDCPPGYPRPGDLIEAVVKDTGLDIPKTSSRLFGNWVWEWEISTEEWVTKIVPIVKPRILDLYRSGIIRYGSW